MCYTWHPSTRYALDDGICTGDHGDHCPLMHNATDLHAEFELAKAAGAQGMVVWGSSGGVQNVAQCDAIGDYVATTLGPLLQKLS
jgi:hypothetical protein